MASAALMLIVLWQRQPVLSIALVGPLLAIALYQRSTFTGLQAMRLALTDPLTGLGNHRRFHERLQRELAAAEHDGASLALCLVDFDDFKSVNDRFGHPVGDLVLGQVASRLRQGGEAFRLGGDEFAVLLPRPGRAAGDGVARSIVERVAAPTSSSVGAADSERRRRDVPDAGLRAGRADPARGQRAVLGEKGRQEPGPRLRGRVILEPSTRADRGHTGPCGAVPGGGEPREGCRRARRVHGQPLASASATSPRESRAASALDDSRSS